MKIIILSIFCLLTFIPSKAQENLSNGRNYYDMAIATVAQNRTTTWAKAEADELFRKALPYLQAAAKEGYGEACYLCGHMYRKGLGVAPDYTIAQRMYERGLEYGYEKGEAELGWMYQQGMGCESDPYKAFEYYQKSADHGFAIGHFMLTQCYYQGIGTQQNISKFFELLQLMDEEGKDDVDFEHNASILSRVYMYLGKFYQTVEAEWIEKDLEKAASYYIKSQTPGALYEAAILIHDEELKIPLDKDGNYYRRTHYFEPIDLLYKAVSKHSNWVLKNEYMAHAYYLIVSYSLEKHINNNEFELFKCLSKSAQMGYGPAQKRLGDWYARGIGTPVNLLKAREWYDKAKANGEEVPDE